MDKSLDLQSLFEEQEISQGQMASLQKTRFSLSNIWGNLALEAEAESLAIGFSPCSRGDGGSFVALHMALLLAHEYQISTLFIDADIEKSRRKNGEPLPGEAHEGLRHFLEGERGLHELVRRTSIPNLHVLPSGVQNGRQLPYNLHNQSSVIDQLLTLGRTDFDAVIIDLPPLSTSAWALSVGKATDSVVIVCRYAQSRRQVCMYGLDRIKKHNIPFSGMVLNERDYPIPMSIYNWLK